jgi:hypothetical protein
MRKLVAEISLWLFVVALSLQMGAGLYEMRVVTPLWSASPPASVRAWNADARYAIEPRAKFWRYCTAAVGLTAALALVAGLAEGGRERKWLVASSATVVVLVLLTYLYFAPALALLLERRGAGLSDEEVIERVGGWLWLGRVRAAAYVLAWLAALKALSVSGQQKV